MAKELDYIKISGYKSLRETSIELSSLNILIGPNGVGKSNFISIFKFLRHIIEGNLQYYVQSKGGSNRVLYYGEKQTQTIKIELGFPPNYYYLELKTKNDDGFFISLERAGYLTDQNFQYWEIVAQATLESKLEEMAKTKGKVAKFVFDVLKAWRVYHFHDTSDSAGVKKYANIADYSYLFEDASNLAAFLYVLKNTKNEYYERIVKTIQLAWQPCYCNQISLSSSY
jgi:predicted ATPase